MSGKDLFPRLSVTVLVVIASVAINFAVSSPGADNCERKCSHFKCFAAKLPSGKLACYNYTDWDCANSTEDYCIPGVTCLSGKGCNIVDPVINFEFQTCSGCTQQCTNIGTNDGPATPCNSCETVFDDNFKTVCPGS